MEEIKLEAQVRGELGTRKTKAVRRSDFIPGIVYGQEKKPTAVKIDRRTFERIERQHKGESVVLHLQIKEGDKKLKDYSTIVKEIQHDPVTDRILHVDFHHISLTEEIEVKVALVAKGEAVGVKQEGGSLEHVLWELDIVCLPTQIPQNIEVDVSHLKLNESVYLKDVVLPEGIKTKHDKEAIIFTVVPPMKEIKPEEAAAAAPAEVEVIKEKKKEEGEAAKKPGEAEAKKPVEEKKPEAK